VPAGFAVVLVLDGDGALVSAAGTLALSAGQTCVVPAGFDDWEARGPLRLVLVRPGGAW
jgi:mannose-6-phosphate isomerase